MMNWTELIPFNKRFCTVICLSATLFGCNSMNTGGKGFKFKKQGQVNRLGPIPFFGFKKKIGHDVHEIRQDLTSTNNRVMTLEGDVRSLRSNRTAYSPQNTYLPSSPLTTANQQGSLPGQSSPPNSTANGSSHRVRKGDTLSSISRHYGIGIDRLISENHITNPNSLSVGQEIFIPPHKGLPARPQSNRGIQNVAPPGTVINHTVAEGENLSRIARRYGITMTSIAQANSIENPDSIRLGQTLKIPTGPEIHTDTFTAKNPTPPQEEEPVPSPSSNNHDEVVAPEGYGFYQILSGDTLPSIAISFGTDTKELRRLNKLSKSENSIQVGDYLLVPVPDKSLYES